MNFAPAPKTISVPKIVTCVENSLRRIGETREVEQARMKITNLIRKAKLPVPNLCPEQMRAIRELRSKDSGLTILPADKGCVTVVLDHGEYERKIQQLLDDCNTYCKLNHDPTPALERKMNSKLLTLCKQKELPHTLYTKLRSTAGRTPPLYGLPKIHKDGVPLRPIVSFIGSPTYNLSKHLSKILSPLVGQSSSTVRNSKQFVDFVSMQTIGSDEYLVSFDVVSLFTNVPTSLAIDVARRHLETDDTLADRTALNVNSIVSLLELCLSATFFSFRGNFYRQTFGTAMGSPVSVIVANLVMEDIEERALSSYDPSPRFWKRYVDDTVAVIKSDQVSTFHSHLNSINPHIQFTMEIESNGSLPFLDVLLTRQPDGCIVTSVYRKATATDKYLSFNSHHPLTPSDQWSALFIAGQVQYHHPWYSKLVRSYIFVML